MAAQLGKGTVVTCMHGGHCPLTTARKCHSQWAQYPHHPEPRTCQCAQQAPHCSSCPRQALELSASRVHGGPAQQWTCQKFRKSNQVPRPWPPPLSLTSALPAQAAGLACGGPPTHPTAAVASLSPQGPVALPNWLPGGHRLRSGSRSKSPCPPSLPSPSPRQAKVR